MVVAVVLDPRYKLQCVNWGYMRIYGRHSVEYELEFSKVKDALWELYEAYESSHSSSSKVIPTTNASDASNEPCDDFMMKFFKIGNGGGYNLLKGLRLWGSKYGSSNGNVMWISYEA
uniref:hAT-like transposase RNase-H fold domain-containing protein n=1 Tax=Chenopodium quinoa TaxID=63459 RepID=A0A803N1V4_CHEQI